MNLTENIDIDRTVGDTYPEKFVISVSSVPVNLDGWDVDLVYQKNGIEYVINCITTSAKDGKVNIYPHARIRAEADLAGTRLGPNDFIMNGSATGIPNQVWDEDEANAKYPFYIVRTRVFAGYKEEMTHNSGFIILTNRYPVI